MTAVATEPGNAGGPSVVQVVYPDEAQSGEAREIVTALRELPVPAGATALVRGETAELVDLLGSLRSILPWMALAVTVTTFLLLFMAFGSLVVPLKAIAMAAVSLCASFGVVVWVFQDGHGSGLLGFTETGYVDATQPILMLAVLFGLSMDYELFLLSRVREEWDRTHDNTRAVAVGVQRTGRIITSAALLLIVVVAGFSTSGITFIKMMGVGMIVALVVDATIVRAVLVPATMRLLGSANWYAPAPLARWWAASGLREHDAHEDRTRRTRCRSAQLPHHPRRVPHRESSSRQVAGDDRPGADHRVRADRHPGADDHPAAEPHVVADRDRLAALPLRAPWLRFQRVGRGEQLDVGADLHVVPDGDRCDVEGHEPVVREAPGADAQTGPVVDVQRGPELGVLAHGSEEPFEEHPSQPPLPRARRVVRLHELPGREAVLLDLGVVGDVEVAVEHPFAHRPAVVLGLSHDDTVRTRRTRLGPWP